jgi:hypothetical protein
MNKINESMILMIRLQKAIDLSEDGEMKDKLRLRLLDVLVEMMENRVQHRRLTA